jgi:DNA-binding NtrC family response regulator
LSATPAKLLVVDDDRTLRESLSTLLRRERYAVRIASDVASALARLEDEPFDLVLTDVNMPGLDGTNRETAGLQLLAHVVERFPGTPVVMITGYGSIASAVDAMKAGAADYITKPFRREEVAKKVEGAVERVRLQRAMSERVRSHLPDALAARSAAMQPILARIERLAASDATVLISGPPGSGKERVARAIHAASALPAERFIGVRCGALHETLYEAELFGHEKGAFTGASRLRRGLLEEAGGGTLFLDGIEDAPLPLQARLLPVLQSRQIRRLGGTSAIPLTARVIAATAADLRARVREERFRSDLFYCLRVVRIDLPPLRERKEDIPELAREFLADAARAQRRNLELAPGAADAFLEFNYPGNVRELRNVVDQCAALSDGIVTPESVRRVLAEAAASSAAAPVRDVVRQAESERIRLALARHPSNLQEAARELRISRTTLWRKMAQYGIAAFQA